MKNIGTISIGIKTPLIQAGDDLKSIILTSLETSEIPIDDNDILGITESIVARSQGNYVTVNNIVHFMDRNNFRKKLILYHPIMSRNRFSLILRAFARFANYICIYVDNFKDEVGNPTFSINPFTGINICDYYRNIAEEEQCNLDIITDAVCHTFISEKDIKNSYTVINCSCHPDNDATSINLKQLMNLKTTNGVGYNTLWGLLGSNKAGDELLKLFPRQEEAQSLVESLQKEIFIKTGKKIHVLVYGDGCFKSPEYNRVSIWEFADPVTCPATTIPWDLSPNERKLKYLIDTLGEKQTKEELSKPLDTTKGQLGTTPRKINDLVASLMDLTSGSGDKGTPLVYVKNYFNHY